MVEQRLGGILRVLGHPTRRAMLTDLATHEYTVAQLGDQFAFAFAAASKHLRVLEHAGRLWRTVVGRTHVCRHAPEPIDEAYRWLARYERFWSERLDGGPHLQVDVCDNRTGQTMLGHSDVKMTTTYTHKPNRGPSGVRSPVVTLLGEARWTAACIVPL